MFRAFESILNQLAVSILSPQTSLDWACVIYLLIGALVAVTLLFQALSTGNVFEIPDPIFFPGLLLCVALWPIVAVAWVYVAENKQPPAHGSKNGTPPEQTP